MPLLALRVHASALFVLKRSTATESQSRGASLCVCHRERVPLHEDMRAEAHRQSFPEERTINEETATASSSGQTARRSLDHNDSTHKSSSSSGSQQQTRTHTSSSCDRQSIRCPAVNTRHSVLCCRQCVSTHTERDRRRLNDKQD